MITGNTPIEHMPISLSHMLIIIAGFLLENKGRPLPYRIEWLERITLIFTKGGI